MIILLGKPNVGYIDYSNQELDDRVLDTKKQIFHCVFATAL